MGLFEKLIADEGNFEKLQLANPITYRVRLNVRRFRRTFPNQRYHAFFHRLESIVKRKLSLSERNIIARACFELLLDKEYVETAEDFRWQLKREAEADKGAVAKLEDMHSLADRLQKHIKSIRDTRDEKDHPELVAFRRTIYDRLYWERKKAPIDAVLTRIADASEESIEELKSRLRRGPAPDRALRECIRELIQAYGKKPTAGWSIKEGRRKSPLVDFVNEILFALPEFARIGREGPYLPAAIEAHVAAVCADLKKSYQNKIKSQD